MTSEENLLGEFEYTYDGVTNRLATVTYPNGQTSTYSYLDDENDHRLQTIHHKYPNTSTLSKFDYTYDTVGNILTWRQQADSTAVMWRYGYDPADQLIAAVKHATDTPETVLKRYAYAYDPAGNRTVEQIDDAVTLSAYDNLNRLTSQAPGGPMVVAGLLNELGSVTINGVPAPVDAANNFRGTVPTSTGTNSFTIVAKDASGNTTTQTYEVEIAGTGTMFTYDANGNQTSGDTRSYSWDAQNRVAVSTMAAAHIEQVFDGSDRAASTLRFDNQIQTGETQRVWCGSTPCEERQADGTTIKKRLLAFGELAQGGSGFYTADHLGSVRELTDAVGNLVSRQDYDPFGRVTRSGSSWWAARGFAGYLAPEIGQAWITVYRAYDPDTARWMSEDPLGMNVDPNYYQYVNNQPVSRIDPLGLFKMAIPPGVGREGCEYYKRRCDETTRECDGKSSDPYVCGAYKCCRTFGEDNVQNCTRRCLIVSDPSCSGRSPALRWTCRMAAHLVCYNRCGMVPIARVEWLPPLNCIATGFGF